MSVSAATGHVILSHGMESGPNATKVTRLAQVAQALGFSSERVDDQGIVDPLRRLDRLLPKIDAAPRPLILVGSSLGAYVSGLALACALAGWWRMTCIERAPVWSRLRGLAAR